MRRGHTIVSPDGRARDPQDTATGPREADRGPDPRSGEHIGAGDEAGVVLGGSRVLPLAQPATTSADRRRRQSGQRIGAAAGPGKRDTPGRDPGEQQMGSGPRQTDGRTDGEGHRRCAAT
ncbi:unnamed protein product [Rangifer tarandus platyrhynchus]|uniref:Uncharacterized protein n=1 Tax=Rangifer tarandus platyrhynchus TaxID=3082113 RepID=A0ABN8YKP6_RANTA|nr:unnamed protein product [Rangifer tarandus platyrhynchus]